MCGIALRGLLVIICMSLGLGFLYPADAKPKRPPVTQIKTPHHAYRLIIKGQESHSKYETDVDNQYWDEKQVLNHTASILIYHDTGNDTVFGKGPMQTQVVQRTMKAWWGGCNYNGNAPHTMLNNILIGYGSVDANTINMKITVGIATPFHIPTHCKDNPPETTDDETVSDQFVDRPFHLPLIDDATTTLPILRDDHFDQSQGQITITLKREPSADKMEQSSPDLQKLVHPSGDYSDSGDPPEDLPLEPVPPKVSPPEDLPLEPLPSEPGSSETSDDSASGSSDNEELPLTLPSILQQIPNLPSVPNPFDMDLAE